ncbi:hypothetical protein ACFO26_02390, partial [Lactococcus nasutitermitis]
SYKPKVPWYDSLSSASQAELTGKYNIPKRIITVHYTRRQAELSVIDADNWGIVLNQYTLRGYENQSFVVPNPTYWYLKIINPALQSLKGVYNSPRVEIGVVYEHFKTTVIVNYYSTTGIFLGSNSSTGYAGNSYGFEAPVSMGYYDLVSAENYSGLYGPQNQVINVYYYYNPPIITHVTHKKVSKTVPATSEMDFDEPMSEWTQAMKETYFRYGKATFTDPNSAGYKNFYKTVYSWEDITYNTTAKGNGMTKSPKDNHPGKWNNNSWTQKSWMGDNWDINGLHYADGRSYIDPSEVWGTVIPFIAFSGGIVSAWGMLDPETPLDDPDYGNDNGLNHGLDGLQQIPFSEEGIEEGNDESGEYDPYDDK